MNEEGEIPKGVYPDHPKGGHKGGQRVVTTSVKESLSRCGEGLGSTSYHPNDPNDQFISIFLALFWEIML